MFGKRLTTVLKIPLFDALTLSVSGALLGMAKLVHTQQQQEQPGFNSAAARRLEVWKETQVLSEKPNFLNADLTLQSQKGTRLFESDEKGELWQLMGQSKKQVRIPPCTVKYEHTVVEVVNADSFMAARSLVDRGMRPLVLNMANKLSIGGGVEHGTPAQEECLFRSSNLYQALYPFGFKRVDGPLRGRVTYRIPIPEFGSYYTSCVQVFRDSTRNYDLVPTFKVDCLSLAGYDLREKVLAGNRNSEYQPEPTIAGKQGEELVSAFRKGTKQKIRHMLDVALFHSHDSLVLGAISCGAFALEGQENMMPVWVADAYARVLAEEKYRDRFRVISFAVLAAGPAGQQNFNVFQQKFATRQSAL